jgi:hypothetical protein
MSRRRARRLFALVFAGALATAVVLPGAAPTEAAFTDTEHAASTISALRLPQPYIVSAPTCNYPLIALNLRFVVEWEWPSALRSQAPYSTFDASNVRWSFGGSDFHSSFPTTGPDANGRYRTTFSGALLNSLLGGLLGNLLGTSFDIRGQTTWTPPGASEAWTSDGFGYIDVAPSGILTPATCTPRNPA